MRADAAGFAASLIRTVATADFASVLRSGLNAFCAMDTLVATAYAGAGRPRTLFHDLDEVQSAVTADFYETGPYLLDPFYLAIRNGVAPGVRRLADIAPKGFLSSPYYETFYRRIRLTDEIGLMAREGSERWIILSLARGPRRPAFSEGDVCALTGVFDIVSAAILRHWGAPAAAEPERDVADTRLLAFGAGVLSPRENEVVRLVLAGHATRAVADALGCAEGTVKAHRRNAYSKLGVSSQGELFALATRFLSATA